MPWRPGLATRAKSSMIDILRLPPDQLASLRAEDVQLYLVGHGWKRDDASSDSQGSVYRYPAIRDAEALLPGRRELADYAERMADIVHHQFCWAVPPSKTGSHSSASR
jgi:hypothetical protein